VKGHREKKPWKTIEDLKDQTLSRDEIYNIRCDRMANMAWHSNNYSVFDPGVSPADCWAIFLSRPIHHKITGKLDLGLYSTLAYLQCPYELHKQQTRIKSFQDTAYKLSTTYSHICPN
jgi:hypothetical protein